MVGRSIRPFVGSSVGSSISSSVSRSYALSFVVHSSPSIYLFIHYANVHFISIYYITIIQELKEEIIAHKSDREHLVDMGETLTTAAETDQSVVDKEAEHMAKRYDDLVVAVEAKEDSLEKLFAKSEKYHASLAPVEELFTKVEQAVSKESPYGDDVEQAQGELDIMKVRKRVMIEQPRNQGLISVHEHCDGHCISPFTNIETFSR